MILEIMYVYNENEPHLERLNAHIFDSNDGNGLDGIIDSR